jgi:lipopolysaccharide export system protein LptA
MRLFACEQGDGNTLHFPDNPVSLSSAHQKDAGLAQQPYYNMIQTGTAMYFLSRSARRLLAAALTAALLLSTGPAESKDNEDPPINIEADRMVSKEQSNTVVFTGNVDASQGKITIRTDEMTVHYVEKGSPGKDKKKSSKVERLVCIGNVEVTQDDWLGTSERMDYYADERKVVLSGNAKAWQGKNMVSGKTITYYLDEKRSIVEQDQSKPGRVRAVIQQD